MVGVEIFANGEDGDMCAMYRDVHVWITGKMDAGGKSARVRL